MAYRDRSIAARPSTVSSSSHEPPVGMLASDEGDDELLAAAGAGAVVRAAIGSGSVANVIHPDDLPSGVEIAENKAGKHFSGAGGSTIKKHGSCSTLDQTKNGSKFGARWHVADVTGPFNSVSEPCGPIGGDGRQDVLFTNKQCYACLPASSGISGGRLSPWSSMTGLVGSTSLMSRCRVLLGRVLLGRLNAAGSAALKS
jgi:hypothetical protein